MSVVIVSSLGLVDLLQEAVRDRARSGIRKHEAGWRSKRSEFIVLASEAMDPG